MSHVFVVSSVRGVLKPSPTLGGREVSCSLVMVHFLARKTASSCSPYFFARYCAALSPTTLSVRHSSGSSPFTLKRVFNFRDAAPEHGSAYASAKAQRFPLKGA